MKSYRESLLLHERAKCVLAGAVASEFRKSSFPVPLFYSHGYGSHIVDVDGNEFLDFSLSQGPLILGHSPERVLQAVEDYSRQGQLFAGQHILELELAEKLHQIIPCAELLRFSLSGSEAVHAALRTARAVSGRSKFIRFEGHYHGWLDNVSFGISAPSVEAAGAYEAPTGLPWSQGLPETARQECIVLPWNNLHLLEQAVIQHAHEIAAIITEPVMCNSGCIAPEPGFIEGLRRLCDAHDICLIFDEVITGFRLALGGAQQYLGVVPDVAIFAKAIANGYPISLLAGKRRWMQPIADGSVIHAGTLNSANATVAAALATVTTLEQHDTYPKLFRHGQRLIEGLRNAAHKFGHPFLVQGPGPMFHIGFTTEQRVTDFRGTLSYNKAKYAQFASLMQERGIRLIGRGLWYVSLAHTDEEIELAIECAASSLAELPV
jgi:glutamate-1-semialdehyde 2,1-aminomutase